MTEWTTHIVCIRFLIAKRHLNSKSRNTEIGIPPWCPLIVASSSLRVSSSRRERSLASANFPRSATPPMTAEVATNL